MCCACTVHACASDAPCKHDPCSPLTRSRAKTPDSDLVPSTESDRQHQKRPREGGGMHVRGNLTNERLKSCSKRTLLLRDDCRSDPGTETMAGACRLQPTLCGAPRAPWNPSRCSCVCHGPWPWPCPVCPRPSRERLRCGIATRLECRERLVLQRKLTKHLRASFCKKESAEPVTRGARPWGVRGWARTPTASGEANDQKGPNTRIGAATHGRYCSPASGVGPDELMPGSCQRPRC